MEFLKNWWQVIVTLIILIVVFVPAMLEDWRILLAVPGYFMVRGVQCCVDWALTKSIMSVEDRVNSFRKKSSK